MSTATRTMASPTHSELALEPPRSGLPQPPKRLRKSLPSPATTAARHLAHTPPLDSAKMFSPAPTQLRTPSKGSIPLPSHLVSPTGPLPPIPTSSATTSRPPSRIPSMPSQTPEPPTLRKTASYSVFPKQSKPPSRMGRPSLNTSVPSSQGTTKQEPGASIHQSPPQAQMSKLRTPTSGSYTAGTNQRSQSATQDSTAVDKRGSDGLESQPSPSRSQNFSDNDGSDSTSATTFEETDDQTRPSRVPKPDSGTGIKRAQSTGKEMKGNVIVSLRVRPDDGSDKHAEGEWMVDGRKSLIAYKGKEGGEYIYDNVYTAYDNNAKVYDNSAKRLIRRVMEGYHGTVFAYGMTGTGKTFSMQGTQSAPGVIPLAVRDIFGYIRETPHREFLLRVSYLEIYNEEIRDLLVPVDESITTSGKDKIKLREDSKGNVYAMPLKEIIVQSTMQLLGVIAQGDKARRTASTQFNSHSSRSHAVVQIVVESRERAINAATVAKDKRAPIVPGGVRVSTLSLIDLAGSEKAAENKDRRTEGAHINKSLLTLGTIISKLSGAKDKDGNPTDKDGKHLPYRDSKLTRLLQSALSGNSLISILCTVKIGSIGGLANHTYETLNTLKFAARAKNNLVSRAKRAEEATGTGDAGSRALLEHYRLEIANLKAQLENQSQAAVQEEPKESHVQRHEEQILELQLARTALRQRIENLNNLILSSQSTGVNGGDGSASAMSMHPRLVSFIGSERDLRSSRASERDLRSSRASGMTLGSALDRSSLSSGKTINAQTAGYRSLTRMTNDESPSNEDVGMGWADADLTTLRAQNAALHEDIMSKNAYILALERKVSLARANDKMKSSASSSPVQLAQIEERDAEIRALKAKLADQDAIIAGLIADKARTANAVVEKSPVEAAEFPLPPKTQPSRSPQSPVDGTVPFILGSGSNDERAARVSASMERISPILARHRRAKDGHGSDATNGTRTSKTSKNSLADSINGPPSAPPSGPLPALVDSPVPTSSNDGIINTTVVNVQRPPSGPLPSPVDGTSKKSRSTSIIGSKSIGPSTSSMNGVSEHRKSVDEVSRMLDEMIQDRVERGELVRSNITGSVRIKPSASNASQATARSVIANGRKSREGMPLPTLPLKVGATAPYPSRKDSKPSPNGTAEEGLVSPIPSQPSAPLTARRIPLVESTLTSMVGDMDKTASMLKLERGERENIGLGLHVEGEPI